MTLLTRLQRLFGVTPAAPAAVSAPPPGPYAGFTVEHYPETKRFYPTRGGRYLKRDHNTGIYELYGPNLFMYADYGKTEEEAWGIIDLYREQQLKENVRVLTR